MERNVNRGILKFELFGFWYAHTHARTRFASAAVFLVYKRMREEHKPQFNFELECLEKATAV